MNPAHERWLFATVFPSEGAPHAAIPRQGAGKEPGERHEEAAESDEDGLAFPCYPHRPIEA